MSEKSILLILALAIGVGLSPARSQSSYDLFGSARADALGNSTTALLSASGVHANPGSRASTQATEAVVYTREGFGLSVLRYGATHVTVPFQWGALSAGGSTFGFEDYREVHLSGGYARSIQLGTTRSLHLGITARYHHTSIKGFGAASTVALNTGVVLTLLRSLQLGAHATNVNAGRLAEEEPLPSTLAVGLSYQALKNVHVLVDLFKDIRFPMSVRGGLEVYPVSPLVLRAGITTAPTRFAGGVGIRLGPLRADVAAEQHQELGWSPSASIRCRW